MKQNQLDKKVQRDVDQVKKGLTNLMEDETLQMNKLKDNLKQTTEKTKEDITTWIDDSTSQISEGFDKLTSDAKETMVKTARVAEKDIKKGLNLYNDKAQEVADLVPGSFSKNVAQYPWVAISIGLAIGLILGMVLKPTRHSSE